MSKRLFYITVFAALLAAVPAMAQTSVSADTRNAETDLTAEQRAEVDAFVKFCADKMTGEAADAKVVVTCRDVLTQNFVGGAGYQRYLADSMAKNFAPAVFAPGAKPIVLVNGAIAVGSLTQPEILPALKTMIVHPNPAVRYHGYKGMARIRAAAVARDGGAEMLAAMTAAAKTEKDFSVMARLFEAVDFSAAGIDQTLTTKANQTTLMLLNTHLQAVRDGSAQAADAFTVGVQTVGKMAAREDDAGRVKSLQAMANVLANAGEAYNELSVGDKPGKVVAPPAEYAALLAAAERSLLTVSGIRSGGGVARAISANPAQKDILKVRLKVNDLVGTGEMSGELAAAGIKAPVVLPKSAK